MTPIRFLFRATPGLLRWTICGAMMLTVTASGAGTPNAPDTGIDSDPDAKAKIIDLGPSTPAKPEPPPDDNPTLPPSAVRFDLVCDMEWRMLSDFLPGVDQMQPTGSDGPWRSITRDIVDLEKMVSCSAVGCETSAPGPIVDVNSERIAFFNDRWTVWHVRWRDGRSYFRQATGHRVNEARGSCRREAFSGFPPVDPYYMDLKSLGPDARTLARDYPPES
jgi:hypothetical protein